MLAGARHRRVAPWLLLPGYDAIREIVLKGSAAGANLGYLGPVADPHSDRRGREALEALDRLVAELELLRQQEAS